MPEINEVTPLFTAAQLGSGDIVVIYSQSEGAPGATTLERVIEALNVIVEDADADLGDVTADDVNATTGQISTLTVPTSFTLGTNGSEIENLTAYERSVVVPSMSAGGTETVAVTVTGATTAMYMTAPVLNDALADGLILQGAWISDDDEVSFKFYLDDGASSYGGGTYLARFFLATLV